MLLEDYLQIRRDELEYLQKLFLENNKKDPEQWPLEMEEGEWFHQELSLMESAHG